MRQDHAIELVHTDALTDTRRLALFHGPRATIIAVSSAFAGVEDHGRSAPGAAGYPRQHRRTIDVARRRHPRRPGVQCRLHSIEGFLVDDGWNGHLDPLRWRALLAGPAVGLIEVMAATVSGVGQEVLEASGAEAPATAGDAALVEVDSDGLETLWWSVFAQIETEDLSNQAGFVFLDHEDLLVLVAPALLDDGGVSEGRDGAVPVALPRVLQHGAVGVLGILAGLVLVEGVEDLSYQVALGILTQFEFIMNHIDTVVVVAREPVSIVTNTRTIDDVIQLVDDLSGLRPRTRSDYKSALRTVARAYGAEPSAVPGSWSCVTREGGMAYGKLFEIADIANTLTPENIVALGDIIREYAQQGKVGPVAIVAPID